jgi:hypothetical protein
MKLHIGIFLTAAILTTSGVHAGGASITHSKSVVIESPSAFPALAFRSAEAMYLHIAEDGRALLYVETQGGHSLDVLDVSNPAKIQTLAQVPVPLRGTFDFVQDIDDDRALIRFRDGSQIALLNLSKPTHPVIVEMPLPEQATGVEGLGRTGLLVMASNAKALPAPSPEAYYVLDTSARSAPIMLATIPAVKQRLANQDTGTIFLLNGDGVTVVRRPRAEQAEHAAETYTN